MTGKPPIVNTVSKAQH